MVSLIKTCSKLVHRVPAIGRAYRRLADKTWQASPIEIDGIRMFVPKGLVTDYDQLERNLILEEAALADFFIDVGAHVGLYSLLVASLGKTVIAIEPLKQNIEWLSRNISLNPAAAQYITVLPVGLSDHNGTTNIYGTGDAASLIDGWSSTSRSYHETITVARLDDVFSDHPKRPLIKIDAEGNELPILRGAIKMLARTVRPTWIVEIFQQSPLTGMQNNNFAQTLSMFPGYSKTEINEKTFLFR